MSNYTNYLSGNKGWIIVKVPNWTCIIYNNETIYGPGWRTLFVAESETERIDLKLWPTELSFKHTILYSIAMALS